jgi:zinc/manganese transport system permease protein
MNILELMAAPFFECMVLVAVHTYLGIHVLKRRVIFVDLALAQTAALGTTVGFFFGIMPDTLGALVFSVGFALLGAAIFSITRFRHERVPQEAVIGLSYAIACAMAVLVVEKTQGAEHLKDILVGNLLWVTWKDVGGTAVVYAIIGAVHVLFRKKFLLISDDPEAAYQAGISVRAWDFLFYVTFALVITLSTRVAGVLLVFVFLVAPGILAFVLTSRLWLQLVIGWTTGTVVTVFGLYLSWALDLPSGPAVIGFYGIALILGGAVIMVIRSKDRLRAVRVVALGTAATIAVGGIIWGGGTWIGSSRIAVSDDARKVQNEVAQDRAEVASRETAELSARRAGIVSRVGRCVGANKIDRYLELNSPEKQLFHIKERMGSSKRKGLELLLVALADDEMPLLYREEAVDLLKATTAVTFGYVSENGQTENARAIAQICDTIREMKMNDGAASSDDN